jgi:hypothetical protein
LGDFRVKLQNNQKLIYEYLPLPAIVYQFDPKDYEEEEAPVVEPEQPKSPRTLLTEENKALGTFIGSNSYHYRRGTH